MVTTIVHVPSAISAWWNDMPTTPHTCPKAHGTREIGSRSSTFIVGFKVFYNWHAKIFVKILKVHHGIQREPIEHLTTCNSKSFIKFKLPILLKILTYEQVIYLQQFGKQLVSIVP
jgi:hypothetical protein